MTPDLTPILGWIYATETTRSLRGVVFSYQETPPGASWLRMGAALLPASTAAPFSISMAGTGGIQMSWFSEIVNLVASSTGAESAELYLNDGSDPEHHSHGAATNYLPDGDIAVGIIEPAGVLADWIGSAVVVPVISPSATTGWFLAAHSQPNAFDSTTVEILKRAAALCEAHLDGRVRSTELRQLSEALHASQVELQKAKAQLEVSNQELEQFAYIAAHELVAPLRSVAVFAEVLATLANQDTKTSPEVANCVVEIRSGVQSMTEQVQYLLTLSRANQHLGQLESIDTTRVAHDAADTVAELVDESNGAVTIATLPAVRAHAIPLQSVFANLITNAVRYRHPDRDVQIHISGRIDGDSVILEIEDNASGITEEARDRIFGLFERNSTNQDGLGVGLAVSRRILEGFGATIRVDSSDEGSTFALHFPVPKPDQAAEEALAEHQLRC